MELKPDLRSLSHKQLQEAVVDLGQPKFRVKQIEDWLWDKNVCSFDDMTSLSKSLRAELSQHYSLLMPKELKQFSSTDGSRKYLLRFKDNSVAECVGMPSGNKLAACVSTQAGCAMGCVFCATGGLGLDRSLEGYEIYQEVMHIRDSFGTRVTSVVFMGQGEPFMNYDNTLAALRRLNSPQGANIGARHLTVSTCGIIPGILRFAKEDEQFTLAVSLHSAVQSTRNQLMPGVKRYSLLNLYEAMGTYVDITGRRPTYEYALIHGVNDTEDELSALCDFLRGNLAHVNLIQLNTVKGSKLQPSSEARAFEFVKRLAQVGVEATIRQSRGNDIAAACGQLASQTRLT